jgi:hypothetical protein
MNLTLLPHHTIDILTAMELTQREGPPAIAKLAMLTLWLVGQESDPHTSYTGPDGLMPIPHLRFVLEKQRDQIPSERKISTQVSLAEVYAYLGDVTTARRLSQTASTESRMLSVCLKFMT